MRRQWVSLKLTHHQSVTPFATADPQPQDEGQ